MKEGALAQSTLRTMDTASTILWLLGLAEPSDWAGQPVLAAYQSVAAAGE